MANSRRVSVAPADNARVQVSTPGLKYPYQHWYVAWFSSSGQVGGQQCANQREAEEVYKGLSMWGACRIYDRNGFPRRSYGWVLTRVASWKKLDEFQKQNANSSSVGVDGSLPAWKWPDKRELIEVFAYIFLWVIGIGWVIKLMEDYEYCLKPLFLAAVFVSVLEYIVQWFEFLLWKMFVLVAYCLRKTPLLCRLTWLALCHCLLCVFGKQPRNFCEQEEVQDLCMDLKDWRRLCFKWDGLFAGKHALLRLLAVSGTMCVVSMVVFGAWLAINWNIQDFINHGRIGDYGKAIQMISADLFDNVQKLPDEVPALNNTATRKWWNSTIEQARDSSFSGDDVNRILSHLQAWLTGLLSVGSSVIMQLVFFFLYALLWLFDPLTLSLGGNVHEVEEAIADIYCIGKAFQREGSAVARAERRQQWHGSNSEEPLLCPEAVCFDETAEKFYKGARQGKIGVHKKLNSIIQTFFALKALVNTATAVSFWLLLETLHVDLSFLLALMSFFLGFIPELGFIAQMALTLPLVLLSPVGEGGEIPLDLVGRNLVSFIIGSLCIKMLVNNIIEAKCMGQDKTLNVGGEEVHPVMVLFAVALSAEIWGCVGMLLAVPTISLVRLIFYLWMTADEGGDSRQLHYSPTMHDEDLSAAQGDESQHGESGQA